MQDIPSSPTMLPTGFSDLMPDAAKKEAGAITALMECFTSFGYQRVKPPLMEFEESLLAPGPGASLARETFRVMDPASHRMMGLRADITPQIARIVKTRFEITDKNPLRLTYANDVLRTRAGQLRTARQFSQVGCEIIGGGYALDANVELCLSAAKGLSDLGVQDITIDFTWPRFVDAALAEEGMDAACSDILREALRKRDKRAVENSEASDELKALLVKLLDASGDLDCAVAALKGQEIPMSLSAEWAELKTLAKALPEALGAYGLERVRLSFDPFETRGFEYHSGVAFTIFAPAMRGELGRGGQYDLGSYGGGVSAQKAHGFTLYMDTILSGLGAPEAQKQIAVSFDTPWAEIKTLQEQGWPVVRTSDIDAPPEGCTHIWQGGQGSTLK